jgi:hypothetical protein
MSGSTWKQYSTVDCTVSGVHGQSHLCYVSSDVDSDSTCEKSSFIILKEHSPVPRILKIKIENDKGKMYGDSVSVCSCGSSEVQKKIHVDLNKKTALAAFIPRDMLVNLVRPCFMQLKTKAS